MRSQTVSPQQLVDKSAVDLASDVPSIRRMTKRIPLSKSLEWRPMSLLSQRLQASTVDEVTVGNVNEASPTTASPSQRSLNQISPESHDIETQSMYAGELHSYSVNMHNSSSNLAGSISMRNIYTSPTKSGGSGGGTQFGTFSLPTTKSSLNGRHVVHIDPCHPSKIVLRPTSHQRRWNHIFPRVVEELPKMHLMKWNSLCTPACLPLTTDYFPTMEELTELYQEYTYTVSLNDEEQSRIGRTDSLLVELISQRLVQGFQLVIQPDMDRLFPGIFTSFGFFY
jgi:hypothetical protein